MCKTHQKIPPNSHYNQPPSPTSRSASDTNQIGFRQVFTIPQYHKTQYKITQEKELNVHKELFPT